MDKKESNDLNLHGSDLEKSRCILTTFRHPKFLASIKFGANVNPLGLSESVKNDLAGHLDIISSYPDRNYTHLRNYRRILSHFP